MITSKKGAMASFGLAACIMTISGCSEGISAFESVEDKYIHRAPSNAGSLSPSELFNYHDSWIENMATECSAFLLVNNANSNNGSASLIEASELAILDMRASFGGNGTKVNEEEHNKIIAGLHSLGFQGTEQVSNGDIFCTNKIPDIKKSDYPSYFSLHPEGQLRNFERDNDATPSNGHPRLRIHYSARVKRDTIVDFHVSQLKDAGIKPYVDNHGKMTKINAKLDDRWLNINIMGTDAVSVTFSEFPGRPF